jgi:DNA-binding SARP family transcriptional activator
MLRVSLLGEQAIVDDVSGQVRARSSRAVALVGYLAVHAAVPQPRQQVAAALWPDSVDRQALTNLRRELHHLRQALGDDSALQVTPTHLGWQDTDSCWVDLYVFQRYLARAMAADAGDRQVVQVGCAALAEYRGELLPGVYDGWAVRSREEIGRDCLRLCDRVVEAAQAMGDLAVAVDVGRRRVQLASLEEAGYRTLMQVQAASGDRAGAISTYHHCASVLERELGVEPDPATRRTLHRLVGGPQTTGHRPGPGTSRAGRARAALVGRDAELADLAGQWRMAKAGRRVVTVVSGGPGVGKTRLVNELAMLARNDNAVVAVAQCFDSSGRLSLGPVADWLCEPVFKTAGRALPAVWREAVGRLVPTPGTPEPAVDGSGADAWQRNRFFQGLTHALGAVDRPTCLVLDNLQWCDEDTLSFLTFLLQHVRHHGERAAMMLALTLRSEEDADSRAAWRWLSRTRSVAALTRIDLHPLDMAQTATLAASLTGRPVDESRAALLHAATAGLPLYLVELARSATPTAGLHEVLQERLAQTSPEAQQVAGLAAAFGRDFALPLLTEASDLDADAVVAAVDELWRHRIVHEYRSGYDFSHDLLRDTAYQRVSPPHRWLLHRRLAQALELSGAGERDEAAAQLAEQHAKAGNRDRALTYYTRAAQVATGRFAHAEAVRLLRAGLELVQDMPAGPSRDGTELRMLETLGAPLNAVRGFASAEVLSVFERTLTLARRLDRDDSMIHGMVGQWASTFVRGQTRAAHDIAEQLAQRVRTGEPMHGQSLFSLAGTGLHLGMTRRSLQHFDAARLVLGDAPLVFGAMAWVHATAWSAHATCLAGDTTDARGRAEAAVQRARAAEHPFSLALALAYEAITLQLVGDRAAVATAAAELGELCSRLQFAYYRDWATVLGGWAAGGRDGAVAVGRGVAELRRSGALARMPYWLSLLADMQPPAQARATLDAALVAAASAQDHWWRPELMRLRARHDQPGPARERLQVAVELADSQGSALLRDRCAADLDDAAPSAGVREP